MWIVNNLIDNLLLVPLIGNSLESLYFFIYITQEYKSHRRDAFCF